MPKRTNIFQKLIFRIHHQLHTDADVVESDLLIDRVTGAKREVDITISKEIGEYRFCIAPECIDRQRAADIQWVEQIWAKHQALLTNKLVLVSKSGFTKTAKKQAGLLGIETITLEEAIDSDWKKIIDKVKIGYVTRIRFFPREFVLIVAQGASKHTHDYVNSDQVIFIKMKKFMIQLEILLSKFYIYPILSNRYLIKWALMTNEIS